MHSRSPGKVAEDSVNLESELLVGVLVAASGLGYDGRFRICDLNVRACLVLPAASGEGRSERRVPQPRGPFRSLRMERSGIDPHNMVLESHCHAP